MLILPDADALRIDLDQLRQRVLQTASQRHRAASRHIQIRIFLRRQLGRGIHRSTCLVDDRVLDIISILLNKVCDHFFRLAGSRSVADYNNIGMELLDDLFERRFGTCNIVLRLRRINRRISLELAGLVQHRHLAAGSIARVDRDDLLAAHRRCHQQTLRIFGENLDSLCFRTLRQQIAHLALDRRRHQAFVRIGNGISQHTIENIFFIANDRCTDQFVDLFGL